ncbi:MAG: hypothetical protein IJD82_10380 [Clostridia bacterium]|nr:hypothetical protein [Clostridia bacterium]
MKRFLIWMLASAMLFGLAACGGESENGGNSSTADSSAQSSEASSEGASSEETTSEPVDLTGKHVIAYGDSITAAGTWFSQAENELGVTVTNRGTGGQNSTEGREGLDAVLAEKPDILLLSYGMNDSAIDYKYVPLETYRQNIADMIERGQQAGAKVILVIENPIGEEQYYTRHDKALFEPYGGVGAFYLQYVEVMRELAVEYGTGVADLHKIFSETDDYNDYLDDGVHPNEAGFALYAQALCDALLQVGAEM